MGVVFAPATGELYAGEPGRALAGRCDGRTAPIDHAARADRTRRQRRRRNGASSPRTSPAATKSTAAFIKALNGAITHASSSIKFCRLAEGAADLYPRFGDVSEWDAAAGHAILKAAGGDIMRLDGSPLRYGGDNGNFLIHGFVAFSGTAAALAAIERAQALRLRDEPLHEHGALFDLRAFDPFIRLVRLLNRTRPTNDRRNPRTLKQPRLRRVGHRARLIIPCQRPRQRLRCAVGHDRRAPAYSCAA